MRTKRIRKSPGFSKTTISSTSSSASMLAKSGYTENGGADANNSETKPSIRSGGPAFVQQSYTLDELLEEVRKSRKVYADMEQLELNRYKEICKKVLISDEAEGGQEEDQPNVSIVSTNAAPYIPRHVEEEQEDQGAEDGNKKQANLFQCPYCLKTMKSALGLKYHVEKFVCRKDKILDDTIDVDKPADATTAGTNNAPLPPGGSGYSNKNEWSDENDENAAGFESDDGSDDEGDYNKRSISPNQYHSNLEIDLDAGYNPDDIGHADDGQIITKKIGTTRNSVVQKRSLPPRHVLIPDFESKAALNMQDLQVEEDTTTKSKISRFICPYCSKAFVSDQGLDYHVQNMVCRKHLRLSGKGGSSSASVHGDCTLDKSTTYSEENNNKKSSLYHSMRPKFQCPFCNKNLASRAGIQYHLLKNVCQDLSKNNKKRRKDKVKEEGKVIPEKKKSFSASSSSNGEEEESIYFGTSDGGNTGDKSTTYSEEDNNEKSSSLYHSMRPKFQCPFCNKNLASRGGLQYHLLKKVCQHLSKNSKKRRKDEVKEEGKVIPEKK